MHENPGVDPVGENRIASPRKIKKFAELLSKDKDAGNKVFCAAVLRVHESWLALPERTILVFRSPLAETLHSISDCLAGSGDLREISQTYALAIN